MFGGRYFGERYFGPTYWGPSASSGARSVGLLLAVTTDAGIISSIGLMLPLTRSSPDLGAPEEEVEKGTIHSGGPTELPRRRRRRKRAYEPGLFDAIIQQIPEPQEDRRKRQKRQKRPYQRPRYFFDIYPEEAIVQYQIAEPQGEMVARVAVTPLPGTDQPRPVPLPRPARAKPALESTIIGVLDRRGVSIEAAPMPLQAPASEINSVALIDLEKERAAFEDDEALAILLLLEP